LKRQWWRKRKVVEMEKKAPKKKAKPAKAKKAEAKKSKAAAAKKAEKKEAVAEGKPVAKQAGPKPEKKKREKKKPEKISKPKKVKRLSRLVLAKKRRMFRGRFGKRSVRNVSDKKWQKWRKPRGIDIYFRKEDGLVPGIGYRVSREIRFLHPSGYREKLVGNMQDLIALEKEKESVAARISSKIGRKKKKEIVKKASELKIVVLNR
jgi:large subunit ribosomal protein L32e